MPIRRKNEELTVITKNYDLILWSCQHTGKFPRNHRFVLGERIERNLYDLLEILIRAKYSRQRRELLEQANLGLEILRFQNRNNNFGFRPASTLPCRNPQVFPGERARVQSPGRRPVSSRQRLARPNETVARQVW